MNLNIDDELREQVAALRFDRSKWKQVHFDQMRKTSQIEWTILPKLVLIGMSAWSTLIHIL